MTKNELIKDAVHKIIQLYDTPDGGVGGYGHIVFDDDNIETSNIKWCLNEAKVDTYKLDPETVKASIAALEAMLLLTEKERQKAIREAWKQRSF